MSRLRNFFRNLFRGGPPSSKGSFEGVSGQALEAHLAISRYGSFQLTEAIRPSFDLRVVPKQGYRHDSYCDDDSRTRVPVLIAAVGAENLVETFFQLLDPLGSVVDVVLETSHRPAGVHPDLYRECIDLPVLKSILGDYEDLLANDGCAGVAVLNPSVPLEVQFNEHKLLVVYGHELGEFESILRGCGVECDDALKVITDAEHAHSSSDSYARTFKELTTRLGLD